MGKIKIISAVNFKIIFLMCGILISYNSSAEGIKQSFIVEIFDQEYKVAFPPAKKQELSTISIENNSNSKIFSILYSQEEVVDYVNLSPGQSKSIKSFFKNSGWQLKVLSPPMEVIIIK